MTQMPRTRKILYAAVEDWAFLRHRLPMAEAARDMGLDVGVITPVSAHRAEIEGHGFRVLPVTMHRASLTPLADLRLLWRYLQIFRHEKPNLVHLVGAKPILYGGLAARLAGVPKVLAAFTGLGIVFTDGTRKRSWLSRLMTAGFRLALQGKGRHVLVQNDDDQAFVATTLETAPDRLHAIPGSGVDTALFTPGPEPESGPVIATLVGRLLWSKGIGELAEAAKILKARDVDLCLRLVGEPDTANPDAVPLETLEAWRRDGLLRWDGPEDDIPAVWRASHIGVLPSYREGLPKSLLEAGACGRPLIATDVPGCRALVADGHNGRLVPPQDPEKLADALADLAASADRRRELGAQARADILERFSSDAIKAQISQVYETLLNVEKSSESAHTAAKQAAVE